MCMDINLSTVLILQNFANDALKGSRKNHNLFIQPGFLETKTGIAEEGLKNLKSMALHAF